MLPGKVELQEQLQDNNHSIREFRRVGAQTWILLMKEFRGMPTTYNMQSLLPLIQIKKKL